MQRFKVNFDLRGGLTMEEWIEQCLSPERKHLNDDMQSYVKSSSSAAGTTEEMLTTQSQNCYREQIQKEMLTRLSWKKRYSHLYPSNDPQHISTEGTDLPGNTQAVLPPVTRTSKKQSDLPLPPLPPLPPPPHLPPPEISPEGVGLPNVSPLMRPVSPKTRNALYQDSSHHGKGRRLYLQRRGNIRPEEKFDFPLLSSWEYGWRLGDYTLDYKTPSRAKSSVVKSTFYARNGVFSSPSASDSLG